MECECSFHEWLHTENHYYSSCDKCSDSVCYSQKQPCKDCDKSCCIECIVYCKHCQVPLCRLKQPLLQKKRKWFLYDCGRESICKECTEKFEKERKERKERMRECWGCGDLFEDFDLKMYAAGLFCFGCYPAVRENDLKNRIQVSYDCKGCLLVGKKDDGEEEKWSCPICVEQYCFEHYKMYQMACEMCHEMVCNKNCINNNLCKNCMHLICNS